MIGAVFGSAATAELDYAGRLAGDLRAGMLLGDRNFAAVDLLNRFAATGAHLLVRCKTGRRLPPVARCDDGSFLARLGALTVRVIDAEISIVTSQGPAPATTGCCPPSPIHRRTRPPNSSGSTTNAGRSRSPTRSLTARKYRLLTEFTQ
ncbi:hypothetical protein [Streptomyces sp. NPDC005322]|uniref:hypothetical protein n=1 Tax=Streptomyces sp. NPDC005322 TaxID=3157032 RepID=UPI0033B5A066